MVIRKSNKHITAQIVKYNADGDLVVQSVHTNDLKNLGWVGSTSNIPSAYLLGYLLAMKTDKKQVIVDIGFQTPLKGSKIFSVVKGAMDGGLKISVSEEVFPPIGRIEGEHVSKNNFGEIKKKIEEIK